MKSTKHEARSTKYPSEASRGWANFEFPCAKQGFTLLEIVVSFGIFFAVVVISIGAVIAIDRAQAKATNFQIIQDNLRFAVEFVTKEIRSGTDYVTSSCAGEFCREIDFVHSKPEGGVEPTENIGFCLRDNAIYWIKEDASGCEDATDLSVPLTSDDIVVDDLKFYVVNPPNVQPRVTVLVHAHSADARYATDFRLETSITQRFRE